MTDTTRLYATDLPEAEWHKSTFSDAGEQCVEIADVRPTRSFIAIRDSKRPTGPAIAFTQAAFTAFLPHAVHSHTPTA
ncbi:MULTISPECIES: DUF397 domain-containing protein [unclassified Streptomyces]|uniref:DUF397 domain-containing protein n=1 Tax=unclassified Streptomyces TaxID=2593676 RepID=UPI001BE57F9E|nr:MULTISPECIES: DUF397 domain-containing protein [unclassified Streptomyces]MBT2404611.1 DUF397 domain-containing protein [Streptomyces sp. ISL-21]MBT2610494.1 DUF397 domain-containing protein [Streptomyces sp. ISL-87]